MDIINNDINPNVAPSEYVQTNSLDVAVPKGANAAKMADHVDVNHSVINRLHLIKLTNNFPAQEKDIPNHKDLFQVRSFTDLCKMDTRAQQYDADDFLYCKNLGFPINHLITLRRYPYPCTDNIWDKETQGEPDIARMITYFSQDVNKLDEILSFSYNMKWKELTAEMEQATMQGEQSGLSGFMKKAMTAFDPVLSKNMLRGENANQLDPKADQNKVYGPVDSLTTTNIRDIGFEFSKEFELTFDYELRSINGRTPEYAMKDIIGNILACTYNNGKFWPGARYWIGERPSGFYKQYQYMNSDNMDEILAGGVNSLKSFISTFGSKGSAINQLKNAMQGGMAMAMGKILDKVGRPGILTMNSLLSGEPTGMWHLTIGNPVNPIMTIGNLICTGVDFNFPGDALSYGDFPTKLQVKIKLKPGQAKDRAGIEMMFNMGKRMYYAPKSVKHSNDINVSKQTRSFFGFSKNEIDNTLGQAFDFIADGVKSVSTNVTATKANPLSKQPTGEVDPTDNSDNSANKINQSIKDKYIKDNLPKNKKK